MKSKNYYDGCGCAWCKSQGHKARILKERIEIISIFAMVILFIILIYVVVPWLIPAIQGWWDWWTCIQNHPACGAGCCS